MRLHTRTWPEVEAYLKDSTGIVMPIGSTEQHGPVGFIGTDAICADVVADAIGDKLGIMVGPTVNVGMAQHHLGFPGSMTLKPSTLIAVICDMVNSLALHGFDRFFFVNGHGGNIATVTAAFSEVYAESSLRTADGNRPPLRCVLRNWWMTDKVRQVIDERIGEDDGRHVSASEVAVTYFAHPEDSERVRGAKMSPRVAPVGPIYDSSDYRRRYADGRIGSDPSLASAEIGKALVEAAVEDLAADYQAFLAEA